MSGGYTIPTALTLVVPAVVSSCATAPTTPATLDELIIKQDIPRTNEGPRRFFGETEIDLNKFSPRPEEAREVRYDGADIIIARYSDKEKGILEQFLDAYVEKQGKEEDPIKEIKTIDGSKVVRTRHFVIWTQDRYLFVIYSDIAVLPIKEYEDIISAYKQKKVKGKQH